MQLLTAHCVLRFSIDDMPLGNHFYYVKPADGFELWPEMGAYYTRRFLPLLYRFTCSSSQVDTRASNLV